MERFVRQTAAQLRNTFYGNSGEPADATGTPTVTVRRDDGTAIVTDAATTKITGATGVYAYTLTPAQTADLDVLTAEWSGVIDGTNQTFTTHAEIVGGFACSLAQIDRILDRGGDAPDYDIDLKHAARNIATDAIEKVVGFALTPRYRAHTFDGSGSFDLALNTPATRRIRSVTVDGTALTASEIADLGIEGARLYNPSGWGFTRRGIHVAWEHGFFDPPADCSHGVAIRASSILAHGPWDDRGYGVSDEGAAFRLLTAGIQGARFSEPEVESMVQRWSVNIGMASVQMVT